MAELWFEPHAAESLARLDNEDSLLARRVHDVLKGLENDPSDSRLRRVRFYRPALWCVTVVAGNEEWAVLWEPHPHLPDAVVVQYLGPASFA